MTTELKRGPNNHYTRDQWVKYGICQNRPPHNKAFWVQWLWEYSEPDEEGGFTDEHVLNAAMGDAIKKKMKELRESLDECIPSLTDFNVHATIFVEFKRDPASGHYTSVKVWRPGYEPIIIEDDLSEHWDEGELKERIEDAMMEAAVLVPSPVTPDAPARLEVAILGTLDKAWPNIPGATVVRATKLLMSLIPDDDHERFAIILEELRDASVEAEEDEEDEDEHPDPTEHDLLVETLSTILSQALPDLSHEGSLHYAREVGELLSPDAASKITAILEQARCDDI